MLNSDVKTSGMNKSWRMRKTKMMMKVINLMMIKKLILILWKMKMILDGCIEMCDAILHLFLCAFSRNYVFAKRFPFK